MAGVAEKLIFAYVVNKHFMAVVPSGEGGAAEDRMRWLGEEKEPVLEPLAARAWRPPRKPYAPRINRDGSYRRVRQERVKYYW